MKKSIIGSFARARVNRPFTYIAGSTAAVSTKTFLVGTFLLPIDAGATLAATAVASTLALLAATKSVGKDIIQGHLNGDHKRYTTIQSDWGSEFFEANLIEAREIIEASEMVKWHFGTRTLCGRTNAWHDRIGKKYARRERWLREGLRKSRVAAN